MYIFRLAETEFQNRDSFLIFLLIFHRNFDTSPREFDFFGCFLVCLKNRRLNRTQLEFYCGGHFVFSHFCALMRIFDEHF